MEFAITSNRVLLPDGIRKTTVVVKDGKITGIEYQPPQGLQVVDAGDKVLMPGIVDPHVHINEPGRTDWEGFDTGTRAAIAGGITTLVDMPLNSSPVTTNAQAFDQKTASTRGKLHTHCGFWGGLVPGNAREIEPLIHRGVLGFKAFLTHSGIDEFPNVTEEDLRLAMPVIARYGLPLLVHCELSAASASGKTTSVVYADYLKSRPASWEDNAIALMIRLCEEYYCPTHIVHVSSADSVDQILKAKERGLLLTAETAQHYLFFTAEEIEDRQTQYKCAPPIREKQNNDKLWVALKDGIIDFVATDHSPAPPAMKEMESGDFMKAWGGISSIQFALPALWTAAGKRGFDIEELARWLCENPARLAGIEHRKGKMAVGYDADFVVWDPDKSFQVEQSIIEHRHKITPYLGKTLWGVVEQTWLAGVKVFDNGKFELNQGKIIWGREKKQEIKS